MLLFAVSYMEIYALHRTPVLYVALQISNNRVKRLFLMIYRSFTVSTLSIVNA